MEREKELLIEQNMGIVHKAVDDLLKKRPIALLEYYDREDCIALGYLALTKAAVNYNAEKNAKFSTYAYNAVTNALRTSFRKSKIHQKSDDLNPENYKANRTLYYDMEVDSDSDSGFSYQNFFEASTDDTTSISYIEQEILIDQFMESFLQKYKRNESYEENAFILRTIIQDLKEGLTMNEILKKRNLKEGPCRTLFKNFQRYCV